MRYVQGDLLSSPAEALVNAVNCVGVMGKGIALGFKKAYPDVFREYVRKCRAGAQPGTVWAVRSGEKWVVHAFTKGHWVERSELADIELCAARLRLFVKTSRIKSIAIPALGCGNGGLEWAAVKPVLENALHDLDADIAVYEPGLV